MKGVGALLAPAVQDDPGQTLMDILVEMQIAWTEASAARVRRVLHREIAAGRIVKGSARRTMSDGRMKRVPVYRRVK